MRRFAACRALIVLLLWGGAFCGAPEKERGFFNAVVESQDVKTGAVSYSNGSDAGSVDHIYRESFIDVQILDKPHNLFIGRCTQNEQELHAQKIIVNNDGNSHISAVIRFNVAEDKDVDIRCVKVYDEAPGIGAYPSYVGGGVGFNYVEIGVTTQYGKGFAFFVQIFGNDLRHLH